MCVCGGGGGERERESPRLSVIQPLSLSLKSLLSPSQSLLLAQSTVYRLEAPTIKRPDILLCHYSDSSFHRVLFSVISGLLFPQAAASRRWSFSGRGCCHDVGRCWVSVRRVTQSHSAGIPSSVSVGLLQ